MADLTAAAFEVAHRGGQDDAPLCVGQALGHPVTHAGHQGVCGAQVNAHSDASLMGVGSLSRFGNL